MKLIERIPWLRIFAEGAIIVVSILLAFAIDAWWDGRKDLVEEREILRGLEVEFVDLGERLDRWAQYNREGAQLIEQFLSAPVGSMKMDVIESTFLHAMVANVLDQGGAIEAVLASGRLEKIDDREIRRRLIKWPDWLEDIHTNDISARRYAMQEITPFLSRHGYPDRACPEENFWRCAGPEDAPASIVSLAEDARFRAMLINRRLWMVALTRDHENARQEAEDMVGLIQTRLAALED